MPSLSLPSTKPLLRPGSRVGVFAPSGAFDSIRLEAGVEVLRSWGLEAVFAPNLRAPPHRYLSAPDASRLGDLCWALGDPDLDAAWLVRGGYGILPLLPQIPWERLRRDRPLIGFSDATLLLDALASRGFQHTIHGPVIQTLPSHIDDASREATRAFLIEGAGARWVLEEFCGPRIEAPIEAPLRGGNLCSLATLCGTPFQPVLAGAILLLEEIGEPPYKVDRLLCQIEQAGLFQGIQGVVLGAFADCEPAEGASFTLRDVLRERLSPLGLRVWAGAPVGHARRNEPFRVGGSVRCEPG